VLSKPVGALSGHSAAITHIEINHDEGIIFTLSEDKIIKLWSARTLTCMQTMVDKIPYRPENCFSCMLYDIQNRQLITTSSKLAIWPVCYVIYIVISKFSSE
jgi:WD40 repeat protein